MDLIGKLVLKVREKMPLEALLFFMHYIWLVVIGLTMIVVIGTGIQFGLDIYALVMTLGLFVLFFVPIVSIGQNIVKSRKNVRKVLCYVPLLIAGMFQTMITITAHTKVMIYESHSDSLLYALLLPIQRLAETAIYPITDEIFYMGFPYNQLPQLTFYIVILPISLFIYLLPSVDYDRTKITKEMKLIALLPLLFVVIPVIVQTVQMSLGLIDEIMIKFFWVEIFSNIRRMGFILMPILGILYVRHYHSTKGTVVEDFT